MFLLFASQFDQLRHRNQGIKVERKRVSRVSLSSWIGFQMPSFFSFFNLTQFSFKSSDEDFYPPNATIHNHWLLEAHCFCKTRKKYWNIKRFAYLESWPKRFGVFANADRLSNYCFKIFVSRSRLDEEIDRNCIFRLGRVIGDGKGQVVDPVGKYFKIDKSVCIFMRWPESCVVHPQCLKILFFKNSTINKHFSWEPCKGTSESFQENPCRTSWFLVPKLDTFRGD